MIKVNLLRDRSKAKKEGSLNEAPVVTNSGTAFKDIFGDEEGAKQSDGQIGSVIKIIAMLTFTALLYYYESVQKENNQAAISKKQVEVEDLQNLLADKRKVVENLEELKQRFTRERAFIEATREELIKRMHFVRGLDSIQTAIVPNLWLTKISYDNNAFQIDGQALYKSDLDSFYSNLNRIPFLNKAIIVKDSEVKSQSAGAYEFSIISEIKDAALGGA